MNTIYQFSSSTRTDLGVKLLGSIEFTYDGKEKAQFIEWTEKNINGEITLLTAALEQQINHPVRSKARPSGCGRRTRRYCHPVRCVCVC